MFNSSESYTEFQENFYASVGDLSLFQANETLNLTKVVLSGLRVNYVARGAIRNTLFWPAWKLRAFQGLKRIKSPVSKPKQIERAPTTIFFESNRGVAVDGKPKKPIQCSGNIQEQIGREKCLVVSGNPKKDVDFDLDFEAIRAYVNQNPSKCHDPDLRSILHKCYTRVQSSGIFGDRELENIAIAFLMFYEQVLTTRFILAEYPSISKSFLICHYHNEGKIYALREHGILVTELQHGLIAEQDIFYAFPKIITDHRLHMLFPDAIWVWGKHWREVLLTGHEFLPEQIILKGDFRVSPSKKTPTELESFLSDTPVKILITTQISLHEIFLSYVDFLAQALPKARIAIKNHPGEKPGIYLPLTKHPNVQLTEVAVDNLFDLFDIQISIYSTTLLEGIKAGLRNYSLNAPMCADYTKALTKAGISTLLELDTLPDLDTNQEKLPDSSYFFQEYMQ